MNRTPRYAITSLLLIGTALQVTGIVPVIGTVPQPTSSPKLPCREVLRWVDAAKEQLLMDGRTPPNYRPRWADIAAYFPERDSKWTFREIRCPDGGVVRLGAPGEPVRCSIHGEVR